MKKKLRKGPRKLSDLTNGAESLTGFPRPRRRYDPPRIHNTHYFRRSCPKCGGDHLAINCLR